MHVATRVYRNEDVRRLVAFIPGGHKHLRLLLELSDQALILQEATVAAIVRAYVSIVTHPLRRAVELRLTELEERKHLYARHQLIEAERSEAEVLEEAQHVWREALRTCCKELARGIDPSGGEAEERV